jgi:plastocyanin
VHVVKVGNANGTLAYSPNSVVAAVGDMVQFQFAPANHTVTQSTFDQPCQPISMNSPGTAGLYSGFMPVTATSETTPTYTIMINNTTPIWLYCSQGKHCQSGMTMVINVKYVFAFPLPHQLPKIEVNLD